MVVEPYMETRFGNYGFKEDPKKVEIVELAKKIIEDRNYALSLVSDHITYFKTYNTLAGELNIDLVSENKRYTREEQKYLNDARNILYELRHKIPLEYLDKKEEKISFHSMLDNNYEDYKSKNHRPSSSMYGYGRCSMPMK